MAEPGQFQRTYLLAAVVVGAGGMGLAVARRLGQSYRLILADRDAAHVEQIASLLRGEGHDATGIACDVTSAEQVRALARQAQAFAPVRALANVVGLSVAAADFRAILAVNIVGAARIAAEFAPIMPAGGCGLFISSSAAHMAPPEAHLLPILDAPLEPHFIERLAAALGEGQATFGAAYALSKIALNRMCRRLAGEWGANGLRIVSLSPGLIATPMGADAYRHSAGKRKLLDAVPLNREGSMTEIATVADFLLSDAASFISGTDILVDGGMIANLVTRPTDGM